MPEPKVLVIEDDRRLGPLVVELVEAAGFQARLARRLDEAWTLAQDWQPDALVLDLGLPDGDGLDFCGRVRADARLRRCGVLMLTARGSKQDVVRGLEQGADDYLSKPFNERELAARLKALLRRFEAPGAPPSSGPRSGRLRLDLSAHEAWLGAERLSLTLREFELLRVLIEHAGVALSRERILDLAWGEGTAAVPKVVDVHCHYLRKKLGDEAARIVTVPQVGYRLDPP